MDVGDLVHDLGEGLAVRDLRLADVGLDLELALHPVDQHLEVQLAHAADDGLAGLLVRADVEGRVLLGESLDRDAQLVLVALRLRLDGDVDHRRGERHRLEHDRVRRVAQGLARGGVLQAHDRDDVAGAHRVDLLALVRVHPVDLADALLAVLHAVQDLGAGVQATRVHAQVGQLAQVGVGHDLERERREGLGVAGLALDDDVLVAHLVALDASDVERARQVGDDRVEHGLDALVLEGRAGEDGRDLVGQGRATDRRVEPRGR